MLVMTRDTEYVPKLDATRGSGTVQQKKSLPVIQLHLAG